MFRIYLRQLSLASILFYWHPTIFAIVLRNEAPIPTPHRYLTVTQYLDVTTAEFGVDSFLLASYHLRHRVTERGPYPYSTPVLDCDPVPWRVLIKIIPGGDTMISIETLKWHFMPRMLILFGTFVLVVHDLPKIGFWIVHDLPKIGLWIFLSCKDSIDALAMYISVVFLG